MSLIVTTINFRQSHCPLFGVGGWPSTHTVGPTITVLGVFVEFPAFWPKMHFFGKYAKNPLRCHDSHGNTFLPRYIIIIANTKDRRSLAYCDMLEEWKSFVFLVTRTTTLSSCVTFSIKLPSDVWFAHETSFCVTHVRILSRSECHLKFILPRQSFRNF